MDRKTVFLDRDGVINENRNNDYVKTWDEFKFLPNAKEAIKALTDANWDVIIVSNQAGVGRGIMSAQAVEEINARMVEEVESFGGKVRAIYYCPHSPDEDCQCRKPKPGMFLRAARELGVNLLNSYLVGDGISDMKAAAEIGCAKILVRTGRGEDTLRKCRHWSVYPDYVALDLCDAVKLILAIDRERSLRKYAKSFESSPPDPTR